MKQLTEITMKVVNKIPIVRAFFGWVYTRVLARLFSDSQEYWTKRYEKGGNSGAGSYGDLAEFKAEVLNNFVSTHNVRSIIEYGCGDGNQVKLAVYESYLGFDISAVALSKCKKTFENDKTKSFKLMTEYCGETAELTLSLDVIYHLVEDDAFESYIKRLFESSSRFVIVYSSNKDKQDPIQAPHVKHRKFTQHVDAHIRGWRLIQIIPNRYSDAEGDIKRSFADFYIYEKAKNDKGLAY